MDLWKFKMLINANYAEVNFQNCTIVCECTEEHLQIALQDYSAQIVEQVSLT